jgi:hypothetical protein
MAAVFAFIVGLALALLIFAIVDKIVGLFMHGWLSWLVSFAIGATVIWIASDYYTPLLIKAFGG